MEKQPHNLPPEQPERPQQPKQEQGTATRDPVRSAIGFIGSAALFLVVLSVFFVVFDAKRQNKIPTFFGYSFSIVVTGSMEPDIHVGELLIVRETDVGSVGIGDDVLFVAVSGAVQGEHIVHRVIDKQTDAQGIYLRTKGTANSLADTDPVREDNFVGKAVAHSVFWGKIFAFLTNVRGVMMLAVLVLTVPFIVRQTVRIVRMAKSSDPDGKDPERENQTDQNDCDSNG